MFFFFILRSSDNIFVFLNFLQETLSPTTQQIQFHTLKHSFIKNNNNDLISIGNKERWESKKSKTLSKSPKWSQGFGKQVIEACPLNRSKSSNKALESFNRMEYNKKSANTIVSGKWATAENYYEFISNMKGFDSIHLWLMR